MLYRRVVAAPTFAVMIILGIIEDQAVIWEALRAYPGAQPKFRCGLLGAEVLSAHTDAERVFKALHQGAVGYLEKTMPLLKEHLLQVAVGALLMSLRVARHVARYFQPQPAALRLGLTPHKADSEDGLCYKLIAKRPGLRLDTVRSYIRQVYRKLEVHSETEVIVKAQPRLA